MYFFPVKHRLQCFAPLLYVFACLTIDHLIEYSVFDSFDSQMNFERAVLAEYSLLLNERLLGSKSELKVVFRHSSVDF